MKTPISYYGGKQQLASKIVSLFPEHKIYCEPFTGGAAVFFAKPQAQAEIINDINSEVVNFYEVLQYDNPDMFDRIKRAWAFWYLANVSFGCNLTAGFGYDKNGMRSKVIRNKRDRFTEELAARIQNVQIECCDALKIIRSRDSVDTLFYVDPPYVGADQGHYDGYSQADFDALLEQLSKIEGKFLLSSFRNKQLTVATEENGWHQIELKMPKPMTAQTGKTIEKIEVLTANYPIGVVDGDVKQL